MKTVSFNLLLVLFCLISGRGFSQIVFSTPTVACVNQTVLSTISSTNQQVAYFSWVITPQEQITPTNFAATEVLITYTSCGSTHTITCNGYDNANNPVPGVSFTETVTVHCSNPPQISIVASSASVCSGFNSTLTVFGAVSCTWSPGGVTQQSLAVGPGNYTVMGCNALGCASQQSLTIGLNPPLNITVSQSSPTTCIESNSPKYSKPVQLNASGAATYAWFPYNPSNVGPQIGVRPPASTCYTVIGATAICSGTAITCVNVIPQFSAGVTPPPAMICNGDVIDLGVINISTLAVGPYSAFTYSWTEALNAPPISMSSYLSPTVSVFPQNTTTYTVAVKDAAGCLSTPVLVTVNVAPCTGLSSVKGSTSVFQLYPNPANDRLTIQSGKTAAASVEIIDALGKVVLKHLCSFVMGNSPQSINISGIPAGIYFIRIQSEASGRELIKLIKE